MNLLPEKYKISPHLSIYLSLSLTLIHIHEHKIFSIILGIHCHPEAFMDPQIKPACSRLTR